MGSQFMGPLLLRCQTRPLVPGDVGLRSQGRSLLIAPQSSRRTFNFIVVTKIGLLQSLIENVFFVSTGLLGKFCLGLNTLEADFKLTK